MAEFNLWLLIVGIAAGAAVMWLVIGTLARSDDEVDAAERQLEAGWIAETIEQHGGRVPVTLVEQILALHRRYLQGGPGIPVPQGEPDEVDAAAVDVGVADGTPSEGLSVPSGPSTPGRVPAASPDKPPLPRGRKTAQSRSR